MDRDAKMVQVLAYASPTNPRVATLMRTDGGKTVRKAVKQAIKVLPGANT